jgi:hypothetical protein
MKMPSWSYTALTAYETCPYRYYKTRVDKSIKEPQTEHTIWGNKVHGAIENSVKTGKPLEEGMDQWQRYVDRFRKMWAKENTTVFTEKQICISKFFTPVAWNSPDAWCRGIVDIGVIRGDHIIACDWKTGKRKPSSQQMQLFAGLLFAQYPTIKTIKTMFIWLKDHTSDKEEFAVENKHLIWQEFLPRVARMERAYADNVWEKKPSGLCRGWCPVTSCEHCVSKK